MTVLVAIYCDDGIVIAGDQQATHGTVVRPTVGTPIIKISTIKDNRGLFAFSGFTGIGQQIGADVERVINFDVPYFAQVGQIQQSVHSVVMGFVQRAQLLTQLGWYPDGRGEAICASLVAGNFADGLKLFEITPTGACDLINQSRWTSIGSGQQNADPILAFLWDVYWKDRQLRVSEAILTAYWAVRATIEAKSFGVGFDVDVFVLEKIGEDFVGRQVSNEQLTDDDDFITRVKESMRAFRDELTPTPQTQAEDEQDKPPELEATR
jgi:20S proteasome alpha/beta subunit